MDGMVYEDVKPVKVSIKKQIKTGKKVKRDDRTVGSMGVAGLLFYTLFWRVFVPNYALIVTTAFVAESTLLVIKHW